MEIFMVSPAPCRNPLASPLDEGACSSKCQGSEMKQKSWETSMGELKLSGVFLMSRSDRQTLISQCPLVERSGVHCFPVDFPLELLQSTLNAQGPFQIPWLWRRFWISRRAHPSSSSNLTEPLVTYRLHVLTIIIPGAWIRYIYHISMVRSERR